MSADSFADCRSLAAGYLPDWLTLASDQGGESAGCPSECNNIRMAAMLTAIVFVKAEVARIPEVAEEIAALSGVSEVYSVTGTIDLIAMIRVANHDQIAEVVADRINKVPGVVSTETHIAFRAYSAHDLEAAFSLGG